MPESTPAIPAPMIAKRSGRGSGMRGVSPVAAREGGRPSLAEARRAGKRGASPAALARRPLPRVAAGGPTADGAGAGEEPVDAVTAAGPWSRAGRALECHPGAVPRRASAALAGLLLAATLAAYFPLARNGFVAYDDDLYVTEC